jgi:hypothetical protein
MIEALIALVLAVFSIFVFHFGWVSAVVGIGGLGFFLYVCILVLEWFFGWVKTRNP